jgi:hypothetical protein
MDAKDFVTVEDIHTQAKIDFEAEFPKPIPPTPVTPGRPVVIPIDNAHAWIDVSTSLRFYNSQSTAHAEFFIVHRKDDKDQRIQGELKTEDIDAFIEELQRVKLDIIEMQAYLNAASDAKDAAAAWERKRNEFVRAKAQEWERLRSKK